MNKTSAIPLLASLFESDPPEVSAQLIAASADADQFRSLAEVGALTEASPATSIVCLVCDEPHLVSVEYQGNGLYRAYCRFSGYQAVEPGLLKQYRASEDWIVARIGDHFQLGPTPRGSDEVAFHIGKANIEPYDCHLFFGSRLSDRTRFERVRTEIETKLGVAPGLLITTTRREHLPGDLPPRCAAVELHELISMSGHRLALDDGLLLARLRGPSAVAGQGIGHSFSPDFRWGVVGDREYSFSPKQALAVGFLYAAWRTGRPGRRHLSTVQAAADTNQNMAQLFADHPAYGTLIRSDGKALYWLHL